MRFNSELFAEILRAVIEDAGSVRKAARTAPVSHGSLFRLANPDKLSGNLTIETLMAICEWLNIHPATFIEDCDGVQRAQDAAGAIRAVKLNLIEEQMETLKQEREHLQSLLD